MTNTMLNTQLYQKIYAEQEQYKAYLMTLPPWEHFRQQEEIWDAVEARSGKVLRAEFIAAHRTER